MGSSGKEEGYVCLCDPMRTVALQLSRRLLSSSQQDCPSLTTLPPSGKFLCTPSDPADPMHSTLPLLIDQPIRDLYSTLATNTASLIGSEMNK